MKNWSWKAILGGFVVDIVSGYILKFGLLIVTVLIFVAQGQALTPSSLKASISNSWAYLLGLFIIGLMVDVFGGFTAAVIAPNRRLVHATIVGFLGMLLGMFVGGGSTDPLWLKLSTFLSAPAGFLGGWWRVKTHGATSKIAPPLDASTGTPPIAAP